MCERCRASAKQSPQPDNCGGNSENRREPSPSAVASIASSAEGFLFLGPFSPPLERDFPDSPRPEPEARNPVPLQLETTGVTSQITPPRQPEFWARQTAHKFAVAAKLREAGEDELATDLEACHSRAIYATCRACNTTRRYLNRCDRFYCPECQPGLSRDRRRAVEWWAQRIDQPKHVVLTVRNIPRLTKRYVQTFKRCISRLRRRAFARNWQGGFYSLEVTNEGKGWHLHAHLLVDARYIDARLLSEQWCAVTGGDGHIVKVRDARARDYLAEVTKYAVKGNQLAAFSPAHILQFIRAFTGVRTFGVFGSLYGKRTEWREWIASIIDTAFRCACGCSDFWFRDEHEMQLAEARAGFSVAARPPPAKPTVTQFDFADL